MRAPILLSLLIATPAFAADWVDLFDGKTLQGWRQHNGTATYRVVDGATVGETVEARPNSFLCTTRDYGDFELEFDAKVHDRLNTGIIVRAREFEKTVGEGRNNHRGRGWHCRLVGRRHRQSAAHQAGSRPTAVRPRARADFHGWSAHRRSRAYRPWSEEGRERIWQGNPCPHLPWHDSGASRWFVRQAIFDHGHDHGII